MGLSACALGASALSLGPSRGTVVLGAPVDLTIEVQPDPGMDLASSCLAVQLVAGDVPVSAAQVRITPWPDMPGRRPAIRVQSSDIVREPVLTATVTAGCSGAVSRTYTYLTELPGSVAPGVAPLDVTRLSSPVRATPQRAVQPAPVASASAAAEATVASTASSGRTLAGAEAPVPAPPPAPKPPRKATVKPPTSAAAAAAQAQPTTSAPRLVMEPLDLEGLAGLRISTELAQPPTPEDSPQRAQAAALWKALNAEPGQEDPRVHTLQSQLTQAQAQAGQERAQVVQLQAQLNEAQSEGVPSWWLYALGLALAGASAAAGWLAWRLRQAHHHATAAWHEAAAMQPASTDLVKLQELDLAPDPRDEWKASAVAAMQAPAPAPAPVHPPVEQALAAAPLPAAPPPKPATSAARIAAGMVNPEDLFDIVQQAEFYVSIGEHDLAIGELCQHIAERGSSSPFSYLELLRLYHQLGRIEAFDLLRSQFMEQFNAQVPEFSHFAQQGAGLEMYTDALAEIEAQWSSNTVLELLENDLFLHPGRTGTAPRFELAAYDDLLLLLAIAQTTPASARGAPPPRKRTTPLMPPTFQRAEHSEHSQAPVASAAAPVVAASLAAQAVEAVETMQAQDVALPAPAAPHEGVAGALAQEWVPPPPPTVEAELAAAKASADASAQANANAQAQAEASADIGLAFDLDDFTWSPAGVDVPAPRLPAADAGLSFEVQATQPQPANDDALTALLEMDFSGPIPLIEGELPPVAVTPPPVPGQAVGFSSSDEKFELRFELQEQSGKFPAPKP